MTVTIRIANFQEFADAIPRLAEILIDAVSSGAGVSFIVPPTQEEAERFWKNLSRAIGAGEIFCFLAEVDDEVAGVVLLMRATAQNQPHRADIAKLLVHRNSRRQGIGSKLMTAAEAHARHIGLKLITFDAVAHGAVEEFYKDLGFVVAGYYPKYAYALNHRLDDTALFFKEL
jgi:GNAT superfamily N-acetyltransferase